MSGKLLHELLREWASNRPFRFNEAWKEFGVAGNDNMLAAFADEIERQYVPVPRFPDGEPVHLGCAVCGGIVAGFSMWSDGSFALYDNDENVLYEGDASHCEPDSLEKLRDDMREAMTSSPDAMFMDSRWVDRLTALMEKGER